MVVARRLVEYTDHRVLAILQRLRGRSPPRPSHGMAGAQPIASDRASSIRVVAICQMSFTFLRMADPTSAGVRLPVWEVGRKTHPSRRAGELLGIGEVIPCVVGLSLSGLEVAIQNTRLHGTVESVNGCRWTFGGMH
jgi:hypothetical protein